ncbi:MAG: hypothetical protein LC802_16290 [Acidobacteria bacterium]|nr:hypothetical protein [Acidobacteriota bacterium]
MTNHDCKAYKAEIEEGAGVGSPQSAGLREHLGTCGPCDQFERERASLRRLVGGLEKVTAPPDFEFRLRARMAAAESARRNNPFHLRFVPGVASVALAACFLIISASVYLRRDSSTNRPEAPTSASTVAPATPPTIATGHAPAGSDMRTGKDVKQNIEIAATPRPIIKGRAGKNLQMGFVGKAERSAARAATFESRPAPVINISSLAPREQTSSRTSTPAVAVRTPAVPLQVVLRDERGAARLVSMRSVSFGAQDMMRQGRNVVPASYKDKEGVW